jgi:hypothetical protein
MQGQQQPAIVQAYPRRGSIHPRHFTAPFTPEISHAKSSQIEAEDQCSQHRD